MSIPHTPAPWRLQSCDHGGAILLRGEPHTHPQSHLQIVPIEDARLIAAAPDLLAACKRSLDWLASYPGGNARDCYEQMRAAIAKAESEP